MRCAAEGAASLTHLRQALQHGQVSSASARSEVSEKTLLPCPTEVTSHLNRAVPTKLSPGSFPDCVSRGKRKIPAARCPSAALPRHQVKPTSSRSHKAGFRVTPEDFARPGSAGGAAHHGQCPPKLSETLTRMTSSLGRAHLPHLGTKTLNCLLFTKTLLYGN